MIAQAAVEPAGLELELGAQLAVLGPAARNAALAEQLLEDPQRLAVLTGGGEGIGLLHPGARGELEIALLGGRGHCPRKAAGGRDVPVHGARGAAGGK